MLTRPNPVQKSRDKGGQLGSYASTNDQILEQLRQSEQICIRGWRWKGHMVHNQNRGLVIWISTLNGQGRSWLRLYREKSCKYRLFGEVLRQHDPVLPWFSSCWLFAGHVLAFPFHLLHGLTLARCWMHKLVTINSHQLGVAQRAKLIFGYPCSAAVGKSCSALSYNKYVPSGKIWVLDSWISLSLCWVEASPLPSVAVSGEEIHWILLFFKGRGNPGYKSNDHFSH